MQKRWCIYWCLKIFQASSCPSSGEQYKADNAYSVQHWPCCSRLLEKKWFGVHLLGLVSRLTSSPRVCCSTASAVHRRSCRLCTVLLMMGMMTPETCWDTNRYIIFSASGWLFIHLNDSRCTVTWKLKFTKTPTDYDAFFCVIFSQYL
jgi:hypothetical protein